MLKLKQPYKWMALLIILVSIMGSCKRSTDLTDPEKTNDGSFVRKTGSGPTLTCNQISEHLKWIARGLAHWPKNHSMVKQIDSITAILPNDSGENPIAYLNTLFAFGNALEDSVDAKFAVNNYDETGLEEFEYLGDTWFTKIYIPNTTYSNSGKRFVVVPERCRENDTVTDDSLRGYFINTMGLLDSMWVDDDNEDSLYVWVVDYYTKYTFPVCDPGDSIENVFCKMYSNCNNDGNCDDGEREDVSCPDCLHSPDKYKLVITELVVGQDEAPYKERFLGGKYELAISYGMEDGSGTSTHTGKITNLNPMVKIQTIKRKDVCRKTKRGKTKGGNCPSKSYPLDVVLYEEIDPSDGVCKIDLVFFELDDWGRSPKTLNTPFYVLDKPYEDKETKSLIQKIPWSSAQSDYFGNEVDIFAMWQANSHNGSSVILGNGEARIKLELVKL